VADRGQYRQTARAVAERLKLGRLEQPPRAAPRLEGQYARLFQHPTKRSGEPRRVRAGDDIGQGDAPDDAAAVQGLSINDDAERGFDLGDLVRVQPFGWRGFAAARDNWCATSGSRWS
jgi:hypothetical protein